MGLLDDLYSTELGAIRSVPDTTRANYAKLKGLLGFDSTGNGLLSDLQYGARNALSQAKWNAGNRLDNIQRFVTDPEYRNSPEVGKAMREAFDQYADAMAPGALGGMAGTIKPKLNLYQKRQIEAQRAAALPIDEGGLGLSPNNTAFERADAMGAVDFSHGTERLDRLLTGKSPDPRRATSGPHIFGASGANGRDVASNYAGNKRDTSRIAEDEGDVQHYFQVDPKALGYRGTRPYSVESTWHYLDPEQKAAILANMKRIGYADPDTGSGPLVLHPEGMNGSIAPDAHWDYTLKREARNNPLTALRSIWHDSGELYDDPSQLAKIFNLAGYPHEISQANAPWYQAPGVYTGKALIQNPLDTTNFQMMQDRVIPSLEAAFKNDRSRARGYGADNWDKNTKTPKEFLQELKADNEQGRNSYAWTSIPDKVTNQLKSLGYDAIRDLGNKGGGGIDYEVLIPFYRHQLRSKFAAFNPLKRYDENDMAALLPYSATGLLGDQNGDQ